MNIKTLLGSTLFILALALVYGLAGATDTQPNIDWKKQAAQNYIVLYGDAQPDATTEQMIYMQNYTALLQAEKNREFSNGKTKTTK